MNKAKLQTLGLSFHPDLETWPLHSGERAFLGSEHTHAFVDFFFSTSDHVLFAELRESTSGPGSGLQASEA